MARVALDAMGGDFAPAAPVAGALLALAELEGTESVTSVAQRVLNSVSLPVNLEGRMVSVTASIGIAVFPDSAEAVADLLKRADVAMYEAKSMGKNTMCSAGPSEPPPRISSWPPPPSASCP